MRSQASTAIRDQLLERRGRLSEALQRNPQAKDLVRLLQEVDGALSRHDGGSFGHCEVCLEMVDDEFLLANPLIQYCLCSLSADQQAALERDLGLATRIQWALLPPQDLVCAGWQTHFRYLPAGPVSGDYCDLVFRRNGGEELFFVIGDVSGKGVAASLLMAHLNAMFRSLIDVGLEIPELVHKANELLAGSTLRSHYATIVCGRMSSTGEVEICNAGHCPPVHVRKEGAVAIGATGMPVGVLDGQAYDVRHLRVGPGETLFLYTDGLTEAPGPDGGEYGTERLFSLLCENRDRSAADLAAVVLRDVDDFRAQRAAEDDTTVLVLRRDGGKEA